MLNQDASVKPQATVGRGKKLGRGQPVQQPVAAAPAGRGQPIQIPMPELQAMHTSKEEELKQKLMQQHDIFTQQRMQQEQQQQPQQQQTQQQPLPVGRGGPILSQLPQQQPQPAAPLPVGRGTPLTAAASPAGVPAGARAAESNKSEMWVCPNCHSLSSVSIPICSACQTSIDSASKTGASLDDAYAGLPTELADRASKGGKKGAGNSSDKGNRGAASDPNVRTTMQGNVAVQEWVNPKFQKEKKQTNDKEAQLLELKMKLAAAEKRKEIMKTAGDTKKVDESDGGAYTFNEFLKFYPKESEAIKKWEAAPTVGKWGLWGCDEPSNIPSDEFLDLCIAEAQSLLTLFTDKKKEYLEKKRKYEISQQEIESAKEQARSAQEALEAKDAAMKAQLAQLEEMKRKVAEYEAMQGKT